MNSARFARWLSLTPCLWACSGPPFRGGYAPREAPFPEAKNVATYLPGTCTDSARAVHAADFSSVELVETQTGRPLLLEHREGYALLVADNFWDDGPFLVFEVIVESENLLRRWRLPRSRVGTGSLEVGRVLGLDAHRDRFQARLASTLLGCSLVPKASDLPAGSTNLIP